MLDDDSIITYQEYKGKYDASGFKHFDVVIITYQE